MQTNETPKMTLQHEVEVARGKLLIQGADLREGDLPHQPLSPHLLQIILRGSKRTHTSL